MGKFATYLLFLFVMVSLLGYAQSERKFTEFKTLSGHNGAVNCLAYSSDGKFFASAGNDGKIIVYYANSFAIVKEIYAHSAGINSIAFSPNSPILISCSNDHQAKVWDLTTFSSIKLLYNSASTLKTVAISLDGQYAAIGGGDRTISIFNLSDYSLKSTFQVEGEVNSIDFSPDNTKLCAATSTASLYLLDVNSNQPLMIDKKSGNIKSICFDAEGSKIISSSIKKDINVWNALDLSYAKKFSPHTEIVNFVSYSSLSGLIAGASNDKSISITVMASGRSVASLGPNKSNFTAVAFCPSGNFISASDAGGDVTVWEISPSLTLSDPSENTVASNDNPRLTRKGKDNIQNNRSLGKKNSSDKKAPLITISEPRVTRGLNVTTVEKDLTVKGKVVDESGVYSVIVNNVEATVGADGEFTVQIKLAAGENKIVVKAEDVNANVAQESFTIVRERGTLEKKAGDLASKEIGTYYALFIGNSIYQDKKIPTLANPIKDSEQLMSALVKNYTFEKENITFLKNATRGDILQELENLRKKIGEKDNLLIFYAGHGIYDGDIKQGYWLPTDAKKENKANWISNGDLRDNLKAIKSKHTLLVSDACFSGGIFQSSRAAFKDATLAIEEVYKLPSRKGLTSGTLTEVSDDSVFLKFLIKRLSENTEKYMATATLFYSIKSAVINNSKQVPQYGVIQEAGDEGGDFIFIKK